MSSTTPSNDASSNNPAAHASLDAFVAKQAEVGQSLRCPHCHHRLSKWSVPDSPFNEWPGDYQYICFNDHCSYFVSGWKTMHSQGNLGSYRFMYEPDSGGMHPVWVHGAEALRHRIVPDE